MKRAPGKRFCVFCLPPLGVCLRSYPHGRAAFPTCWLRSASAGLGAVPGLRETHLRTRRALPSNPPGGHTCKPAEDPTSLGLGGMEACMALEGGRERGREALTQTRRLEQVQEELVLGLVFKAEAESEWLRSLTCPHLSQWVKSQAPRPGGTVSDSPQISSVTQTCSLGSPAGNAPTSSRTPPALCACGMAFLLAVLVV